MHDGRVRRNRSTNRIGGIINIHNNDLVRIAIRLADTNELVRFHRQRLKGNRRGIDAEGEELITSLSKIPAVSKVGNVTNLSMLLELDGERLTHLERSWRGEGTGWGST